MQRLASYDPYTINEVQFFVQKKTKYTTLKSILISLIIFGLTVALNINMVEQLWIPRSELSIVSSQRKMSQQPFTSSYICIIAKTLTTPLANTTLYTYSYLTNRTLKTFSLTNHFNQVEEILNITNGRNFACYDFQGAVVNDVTWMKLTVDGTNSDFDFMFKTYTSGEIIGTEQGNYLHYKDISDGSLMGYQLKMKKIRGVIYDSLMISYSAQQIMGFSPTRTFQLGTSAFAYSYIEFSTEFDKPYDTTTEYVLRRANIGQILGKLLSWFSIFVMIAAFGVSPILDYNYKVELCKKLYDNPKLNSIDLSLVSYLKYLISRVKRNLFNEDVLQTSFQQLQKDVDLLNLIKKQRLMKKLIKENEYINMQPIESQNILLEENSQYSHDLFIGKQHSAHNQLLSQEEAAEINEQKQLRNNDQNLLQNGEHVHPNVILLPLITEPDEQSKQGLIKSVFKCLDASQTSISLISNKGEGYKTSWNTILSIVFVGAVLWFIIFAGLFEMESNYTISSILVDQNATLIPNITINPEDILFRANKTLPSYNYVLTAVILNSNDQIVQNLTLLNGTSCDSYRLNLNDSSTGWLCLNKSITLYNDGKNNKTKLGLKLTYVSAFGFSVTYIETLFYQYNIVNDKLQKTKMYNSILYSTSQTSKYNGQAILYQNQDQQLSVPEGINQSDLRNFNGLFWTCNKAFTTTEAVFKGITYQITDQIIKITKQTPTIWDVIDTAWGIVVLSFSVFLSKITRYLNVKQREKIIKGEQNQNRNDIVAIISTQYKLIYQVFYKELQQVKFFYKTNYDEFGAKER